MRNFYLLEFLLGSLWGLRHNLSQFTIYTYRAGISKLSRFGYIRVYARSIHFIEKSVFRLISWPMLHTCFRPLVLFVKSFFMYLCWWEIVRKLSFLRWQLRSKESSHVNLTCLMKINFSFFDCCGCCAGWDFGFWTAQRSVYVRFDCVLKSNVLTILLFDLLEELLSRNFLWVFGLRIPKQELVNMLFQEWMHMFNDLSADGE